jgi:hypothetical protein
VKITVYLCVAEVRPELYDNIIAPDFSSIKNEVNYYRLKAGSFGERLKAA